MITAKEKSVVFYLFKRVFRQLLFVFMWFLIGGVIFPMTLSLITGSNYNLLQAIRSLELGPTFYLVIGCLALLSYDDFKLLIQNGVSRYTYWKAKVITFIGISVLSQTIAIIYFFLMRLILNGNRWEDYSLFMQVYGGFFKNTTIAYLVSFIFAILSAGVFSLSCILVGSIFSLFTKRQRRLIILALITLFIVGIATISNTYQHIAFNAEPWFVNTLNFLVGYDKGGTLNPTMPFIDMVLLGIIVCFGSLQVIKRFKIRNE
ncbi:hypothetical protein [Liquorilactobacillus capillatus]|uniref:ABC transporter, permease n=1 Tax=Liquorilactobacillus capillatus DSM 19910 TaxID=1423731 RepID=A0A0R1MAG4_9LACO|nr:hypothetical protein [Liquorilactobacillus capillatus]KRL00472.1 ABC transporter, permease [Liquorilactobacillus capillatus DSM 19910]